VLRTAFLAAALVRGTVFSSTQSNYVVRLDFDGAHAEEEVAQHFVEKEMVMGGDRKFKCVIPRRGGSLPTTNQVVPARSHTAYLLDGKVAPLQHGKCIEFQKDYWSYEVCFRSKITQFRRGSTAKFSLGEYNASVHDKLYSNGTFVQTYEGGTDGRRVEVVFLCGKWKPRQIRVTEPTQLSYVITFHYPGACDWSRDGHGFATTARTEATKEEVIPVSALLEPLRDNCLNRTEGWWTYQYCFPHTLRQFHVAGSGAIEEPVHVLGTSVGRDVVSKVDFKLKSEPPLPSMEITKTKGPAAAGRARRVHRILQHQLGHGSHCDETSAPRSSMIIFECPEAWADPDMQMPQITSIAETTLCQYEIVISTTLVCSHPKLIPRIPRAPETIRCTEA